MKVVLIEDEDMLRKSLSYFLRSHNYIVEEFDNGADAIQYIQEFQEDISVVITDLNLPFAGGKEVIFNCRNLNSNHIKIVVLTSSVIEATELEVFDLGADEFIPKPFSPQVLLKRIQKLNLK